MSVNVILVKWNFVSYRLRVLAHCGWSDQSYLMNARSPDYEVEPEFQIPEKQKALK